MNTLILIGSIVFILLVLVTVFGCFRLKAASDEQTLTMLHKEMSAEEFAKIRKSYEG